MKNLGDRIKAWVDGHRKLIAGAVGVGTAAVAEYGFDARWATIILLLGGLAGVERATNAKAKARRRR